MNLPVLPELPVWLSPLHSILDNIKLYSASILIAPTSGDLAGIHYDRGFAIAADAEIFRIRIGGSLQMIDTNGFGFDFEGGFGVSSSQIPDLDIISLIQVVFPGIDFGWLDSVLSAVGLSKIDVSDILDIRAINLTDLSIAAMARGKERTRRRR